MAYEVTATRRRPQKFEDLIGQEFVAATLKNSIQTGKIAHAYLLPALAVAEKLPPRAFLPRPSIAKRAPLRLRAANVPPAGKSQKAQALT